MPGHAWRRRGMSCRGLDQSWLGGLFRASRSRPAGGTAGRSAKRELVVRGGLAKAQSQTKYPSMTELPTKERVLEALRHVKGPDSSADIVAQGLVSEIVIH